MGNCTSRSRRGLLLAAGGLTIFSAAWPALAANTDNWKVASGNWNTAGNWSTTLVPGAGDTVNIGVSNTASFTVTYDYTGSAVTLSSLTLNTTNVGGTTTATLLMSANNLTTTNEFIGDSGAGSNGSGAINQSGGNNTANGTMFLGFNATDKGAYSLSGTAHLLGTSTAFIGNSGTGIFSQTGGTSSFGFVDVGVTAGAVGTCTLSGTSSFTSQGGEVIGDRGAGVFNQSGGTNNADVLSMANAVGSTGTYILSGGTLTTATNFGLDFGYNGNATFNQTGGTFVGGGIQLADNGGTSSYTISGTASLSCADIQDGYVGSGTFTQNGGSVTLTYPQTAGNTNLQLGDIPTAVGTYVLTTGSLSTINGEVIGYSGTGVFNQSGGSNTITAGELDVAASSGSHGTYTLSAGSLSVTGNAYVGGSSSGAGGTGTLTVSNTGQMSVTGSLDIFAKGSVSISGTVGTVGGLFINTGGLLNVNSALLITPTTSSEEQSIQQYIEGGSIVSTYAASNGLNIAYAYGNDGIVTRLPAGEIVIEPALAGDTDLSGTVNIHDLQNLLGNFNQAGYWDQGNFIGHATVDISNLQALLTNFNTSTALSYSELEGIDDLVGQFGEAAIPDANGTGFTLVAVPEPSSAIVMAAGIGLLARKRRRHAG
jgi:hypothetical protein